MKKYFIILLIFAQISLTNNSFGNTPKEIQTIREDLFYSDFDIDKCWEFYNYVTSVKDGSAVIKAYEAVADALIAKYSWNPMSKYNYLKKSAHLMDKAVSEDKNNLEIRFLRLYIQRSIPDYMGMSEDIEEDKQVIMSNLNQLNASVLGEDIVKYIIKYMSSPEVCTPDEAILIKSKLTVH
ncbi:hypothetical protein [Fulvivirga ligni]|uniref:hypothetical protein n=1 Tax=Fulvivirga ligni TaxID=2904246 RepID=UPI001F4743B5|nr:hypothetical protein [Fulvivirga ligni]UII22912.1 hypothetical protein LVD16_06710 [Fulvivirga ligni]